MKRIVLKRFHHREAHRMFYVAGQARGDHDLHACSPKRFDENKESLDAMVLQFQANGKREQNMLLSGGL